MRATCHWQGKDVSLSITLLSHNVIYQCGDFRLTDFRTRQPLDFVSQKSIVLQRFGWTALVSFVGVGHTGQLDVAEWLAATTAQIPQDAAIDALGSALLEANDWLGLFPKRHAHTFSVGAFVGVRPRAILVSNFESLHARPASTPGRNLKITQRFFGKPSILVTGQPGAVREEDRLWLLALLRESRPYLEVHQALADVNARAARTNPTISPACFTAHVSVTGEGEAIPHGLDEDREYQPSFSRQVMPGLTLKPALDD
jgi:hypothetical protein